VPRGSNGIETRPGFVDWKNHKTRCTVDLSTMQGLMVIVGPILLAIAIAWAIFNNRGSRREVERTEEATRMRYDQQDREDKARQNGGVA
jgi:hypothetical protein